MRKRLSFLHVREQGVRNIKEGKMRRSEQIIKAVVWGLCVCLGGYLAARGYLYLRQSPGERAQQILGDVCMETEREAYLWYVPGIFYEEGNTTPMITKLWTKIENWYPLGAYLKEQQEEESHPVIEDESTCYEMIHANGNTIADRLLGENQGEAVTQENETAKGKTENDPGTQQEKKSGTDGNTETRQQEQSGETDGQKEETAQAEGETAAGQESDSENAATTTTPLPAWTTAVEATPKMDLSLDRLSDFQYLLNNFFVVDPNTTVDGSQINAGTFLGDSLALEEDSSVPQILIYHTHSQEGFADSTEGDEATSVIGVGDYLTSILQDVYGYQVIHRKDAFDLMEGQLDRSKAYNYALPVIEQVLAENPTIQVVIDLHRDGVPEGKHLVTEINGKPTAQIMYFNGLSRTVKNGNLDTLPNPYIEDNLSFSFQLSYQAARYYPQLTRCIYLKGYRYNLHVRPRSILLEVGAQTNTVEEAMNAMEPFSVILDKVLKGE